MNRNIIHVGILKSVATDFQNGNEKVIIYSYNVG